MATIAVTTASAYASTRQISSAARSTSSFNPSSYFTETYGLPLRKYQQKNKNKKIVSRIRLVEKYVLLLLQRKSRSLFLQLLLPSTGISCLRYLLPFNMQEVLVLDVIIDLLFPSGLSLT